MFIFIAILRYCRVLRVFHLFLLTSLSAWTQTGLVGVDADKTTRVKQKNRVVKLLGKEVLSYGPLCKPHDISQR